MRQVGCAALLGFTWLNYQPGNPALSSAVLSSVAQQRQMPTQHHLGRPRGCAV